MLNRIATFAQYFANKNYRNTYNQNGRLKKKYFKKKQIGKKG